MLAAAAAAAVEVELVPRQMLVVLLEPLGERKIHVLRQVLDGPQQLRKLFVVFALLRLRRFAPEGRFRG